MYQGDRRMTGAIESKDKHWVPAQAVPNYGLVYPINKSLQKQLEDLNAMRMLNHDISRRIEEFA
jgi:hypothetical protein